MKAHIPAIRNNHIAQENKTISLVHRNVKPPPPMPKLDPSSQEVKSLLLLETLAE